MAHDWRFVSLFLHGGTGASAFAAHNCQEDHAGLSVVDYSTMWLHARKLPKGCEMLQQCPHDDAMMAIVQNPESPLQHLQWHPQE